MNILILNWRDLANPSSGGAERITQKYAKHWISKGHSVFWISNKFSGGAANEVMDGIQIMRVGPALTRNALQNLAFFPIFFFLVILKAFILLYSKKISLIIDEIHGVPFFTPLFFSQRKILLVCEVAGEIWDKMWPFPINSIGKRLERGIYQLYGKTEMWAISENTKKDILELNSRALVKILPLGVDDYSRFLGQKKKNYYRAVFLARLVEMKGIEIAIDATKKIVQQYPQFQLIVVGRGTHEYMKKLERKIAELKIKKHVIFKGFVSENEKFELLRNSDFLFHTSYKEGFGLTVLEAGLVGTPSIIKAGSSLEELVTNDEDGFIITSADEVADAYIQSIQQKIIARLSQKARKKAERYLWPTVLKKSDSITKL